MLRTRLAGGLAALLLALPACDSSETGADGPLAEAYINAGQWTFIDVEGSQCRDGSATGIGVRIQEDSDDLVIYLEGGGACFNGATCATNPDSFSEGDFASTVAARGNAGLFSTTNAANPVADWNMVYVPYCTGDVHAGSFPNNTLLQAQGVAGAQQFVGHLNVERALDLLAEGLDSPDRVLLTGSSAGGLGALFNFDATAETFTDSDLFLVDDSGPVFFEDNVYSPDLSAQVVALYNGPVAISDAAELFQRDALPGIYEFYADRYPEACLLYTSDAADE